MSLAPFLSQIAPQPELGTWGLDQHFSLQNFFFIKRGFFSSSFVHSDLGNTPTDADGKYNVMKAKQHYQTPADIPAETDLILSAFGGQPAQAVALWPKDHTDFSVQYTQMGDPWLNHSVETAVSSTVADSQEFKIKCRLLVMRLLQNKKHFAYLKAKCLQFLTAVNVFAQSFPAGFLLYSDSLYFVTHEKYLGLEDSLKLLVNSLENMV